MRQHAFLPVSPMRRSIILCLLLLLLQLFFCFKGVVWFGKYINPFLLFAAFSGQFVLYQKTICDLPPPPPALPKINVYRISIAICGIAAVVFCFPAFSHIFHTVPDPGGGSDVIPQLETQYHRFVHGEMPYRQLILHQSKPFPVYMPLHWLPVGITDYAGMDTRWSGLLLLVPGAGLCIYTIVQKKLRLIPAITCIALVPVVLLAALYGGDLDLPLSLETIVAAYYLIVCAGLLQKNLLLTTVGIALCLLSRYTLIFWLPVFFYLLFTHTGAIRTTIVMLALITAFCVIYVFPFLLKDSSIFIEGLRYHNGAAEFEWKYGQLTFDKGIYFAPHIDAIISGSYPHKVFIARICQATAMLSLCVGGILHYRRVKSRVNYYDYALGMLYMFLAAFYMIGPLTYGYYMLTPLLISAVMCMKIVTAHTTQTS